MRRFKVEVITPNSTYSHTVAGYDKEDVSKKFLKQVEENKVIKLKVWDIEEFHNVFTDKITAYSVKKPVDGGTYFDNEE